jgi:hypothetical protein
VGVDDDSSTWLSKPRAPLSVANALGVRAVRVSVDWHRGESVLAGDQRFALTRGITSAWGMRVVLSVTGLGRDAPTNATSREQYCSFVKSVLQHFPTVNDVVIWNEANSKTFWRPASPARYEALLARCWDVLHAYRRTVNVIDNTSARGVGKDSMAPAAFIRGIGAAYRASRRQERLFDTVGHHPYPATDSEPPWRAHPTSGSIGMGDLDKLETAYRDAFANTAQPAPGSGGVTIWYLEDGYQSAPPSWKSSLYRGHETAKAVDPQLQADNLAGAVRLAYCQPHVSAFFNFELFDERDLAGWQSGVLYADGSAKPAYGQFKAAVADANANAVDCRGMLH